MIPVGTEITARGAGGVNVTLAMMTDAAAETLADAFAQMPPWSCYPVPRNDLVGYLAGNEAGAPRYTVRLADGSNAIIGALGLRENWLRGPYIQFLGLTRDFQNHGIGAALLGTVEDLALETNAHNLWVMASQFNDRALVFYRRWGFSPVASIDALVAPEQTEVLLRKRLR